MFELEISTESEDELDGLRGRGTRIPRSKWNPGNWYRTTKTEKGRFNEGEGDLDEGGKQKAGKLD